MHLKRWLTGIIATPALIYVIGMGPRWLFHVLLFLAALQGLREFHRFSSGELPRLLRWEGAVLTFFLFVSISAGEFFLLPVVVFLWAAIPMASCMMAYRRARVPATEILGPAVLGPLYVAVPLSMLVVIDRFPQGNIWIFYLLFVVFAGDTGAFYVGRALGKHKLYPAVSPGKTWEGAVGGWLASLVAAFVWCQLSDLYPFNLRMAALTTGVSVLGQIGDLAESMLKRDHGVKDSGGILPGHGGILDRIDALLFAIPAVYVFLSWSLP